MDCPSACGRVLVMDDEKIIRDVTGRILREFECLVDFAVEGTEAIALYRQAMEEGRPYNLVILDLTIAGGMGGLATFVRILEMDPKARAVITSGFSDDPVLTHCADYGFKAALVKPYAMDDVRRVLREVLEFDPSKV